MHAPNPLEHGFDRRFTRWRTSSFSNPPDNQCVEVAHTDDAVAARDSKNRGGGALVFGRDAWSRFVSRLGIE